MVNAGRKLDPKHPNRANHTSCPDISSRSRRTGTKRGSGIFFAHQDRPLNGVTEMTLAEELAKLEEMHQRGGLTDTEFAQAKARLLHSTPLPGAKMNALNGLCRSTRDSWIGGVCGGLASFTGMDSWLWRLLFALTLLAGGIGFVIYVLMWILVPRDIDL
jgi:phage shock protein PspC (stress-responsive transcriptional regulator)